LKREKGKAAETKKGEAGRFGNALDAQVVDGHDIVTCAIERWYHRAVIQSLCANLGFVREIPDKANPTHRRLSSVQGALVGSRRFLLFPKRL